MNRTPTKLPGAVLAGLVLAVGLDTCIQIAWKLSVTGGEAASVYASVVAALHRPWFYAAMLAFGAQLFNWLRVLARADLSFAQPFTALSYVTVLILSNFALHERISWHRWGGVALILAGVVCISRTPVRTTKPSRAPEPPVPIIP